MTEQMAVEHIRNLAGDYKCWDDRISREESLILCNLLDELEQYRALGTVEELRVARDKQVGKKVIPRHIRKYDGFDDGECPTCGNSVLRDGFSNDVYCDECGQKLDWSDEE